MLYIIIPLDHIQVLLTKYFCIWDERFYRIYHNHQIRIRSHLESKMRTAWRTFLIIVLILSVLMIVISDGVTKAKEYQQRYAYFVPQHLKLKTKIFRPVQRLRGSVTPSANQWREAYTQFHCRFERTLQHIFRVTILVKIFAIP